MEAVRDFPNATCKRVNWRPRFLRAKRGLGKECLGLLPLVGIAVGQLER